MGSQRGFASLVRAVSLAVAAFALATLAAPSASAQSPEAAEPEVAEAVTRGIYLVEQGPHRVTVQTIPSVPAAGTVHFVVTPTLIADGSAVTSAIVLIVVDDDQGEPTYQSLALNPPDRSNQYTANILVKKAGDWTVRVNLQIGGDELVLSFPLEVIERSITGGIAGTISFFVVLAVLLGGAGYLAWSSRRRRASQR